MRSPTPPSGGESLSRVLGRDVELLFVVFLAFRSYFGSPVGKQTTWHVETDE